jgi:exo-beta-1,3-glucanase (GH17 family)
MKVDKAIILSLLAAGISGAPLPIDKDADIMAHHLAKRGFLSDLVGLVVNYFSNGSGTRSSAAATTAPAPTTPAPAPTTAATAALVASAAPPDTAIDTAEATQAPATSSSDDDDLFDGWFPKFTWPSRTKTSLTAVGTSTASSADPIFSFSATVSGSFSTSDSSSTSTPSSGGSVVEQYSEKSGGIAYSPYTKDGQCKSQLQVAHDMNVLSAYKIIRLYGVDCSGVENTLASINSDQKLFVGIYNIDSNSINTDLGTLKTAVEGSSRGWDAIDTVSIGNELVNAGTASASQIVTAVKTAKSWFKLNAPDYTGPVVSVDTLVAVLNNPTLCDASDYLAVNSHPFWDGGVAPQNSGSFLQSQISNLRSTCGSDKKILITESGWPTKGDNYGLCVPSVSNQLLAIKSIVNALGEDVLMFTTYNDYWKDGGLYGVEKYWGIYGDPAA